MEAIQSQNAGLPFQCGHCNRKFRSASILDEHVRSHSDEKPYKCALCFVSFKGATDLEQHVEVHSGQSPSSYQLRSEEIATVESETGDMPNAQLPTNHQKLYECEKCNKKFSRAHHLRRHEVVHSKDRPYECLLCNKRYRDPTNLRRHFRLHVEPEDSSGFNVLYASRLTVLESSDVDECQNHTKTSSKAGRFEGHDQRDNNHIDVHEQGDSVLSNTTSALISKHGKDYIDGYQLKPSLSSSETLCAGAHLNKEVSTNCDEKPYICEQCCKRFKRAETLKSHVRVHSGEKPYEYTHCIKRFSNPQRLKNHLMVHNDRKSCHSVDKIGKVSVESDHLGVNAVQRRRLHSCDECGKTFQQSDHLLRHKQTHSGEKPYACTLCIKRYGDPTTLRRHLLVHSSQKNLNHPFVEREDKQANALHLPRAGRVDHPPNVMLSNTDVMPHVCGLCGKSFRRADHLKRHSHIHSGERPYGCEWCSKRFKDPTNLRRHLLVHTGTDERPHKTKVFCNRDQAENGCEDQLVNLLVDSKNDHTSLFLQMHCDSDESPYVCEWCERRFTRAVSLKKHLKTHTDEKLNESWYLIDAKTGGNSLIVENNAPTRNALNMTVNNEDETFKESDRCGKFDEVLSQQRLYSCDQCGKTFQRKYHLIRHQGNHTVEKPYTCTLCDKRYVDDISLMQHIQHHAAKLISDHSFIKQECEFENIEIIAADDHPDNFVLKPFVCELCDKRFGRVKDLKRHSLVHGDERPYACKVCSSQFKNASSLRRHFERHIESDEKLLECRFCCKRYCNPYNLKRHEEAHAGSTLHRRRHACDQCNKTFQQSNHLKRHQLTHSGEKPYECMLCVKKFGDPSTLRKHLQNHAVRENPPAKTQSNHAQCSRDAKPHLCEQCGKRFNRAQNLTRHAKVHCTAKLYECKLCCMSFIHKGTLKNHLLLHSGAKPSKFCSTVRESVKMYSCEICGKSFRWSNHLIRHELIHSSEKPYSCSFCTKKYRDPTNLRRHRQAAHADVKPHGCQLCDARFVTAAQLAEHMRCHHGGERPENSAESESCVSHRDGLL